jgi:hypothetical protein
VSWDWALREVDKERIHRKRNPIVKGFIAPPAEVFRKKIFFEHSGDFNFGIFEMQSKSQKKRSSLSSIFFYTVGILIFV